MLDEFVLMFGCHRRHTVRRRTQSDGPGSPCVPNKGQRMYDEAVREALTVVWDASDRICGRRLKAALTSMVESPENYGRFDLVPDVRRRLFSACATMERLLRPIR